MIKEDVRIDRKTNWVKVIIFFILIGLLGYSMYNNGIQQDNYRKSFKGETIALTTRIKKSGKWRELRYYFYTDQKILSGRKTRHYEGNEDELINKFFKVKYNLKDPQENYIVLEEELEPDSLTLVKAGFTRTKYYIYDVAVSSKYIEKSKWK
ncbi:MAG TPA: hypothetical protein VFS71_00305 [Flavobacterium sp.]|uniref:hypothetical protein n=1 Tax=Flavobacterium sp. TaxID=239 RepID=UPI002DBB7D43|nr:hypothetical protein [Flavobacterium sp.]HEU4788106.1 hypothetical protein [Flavobacterium sp.]